MSDSQIIIAAIVVVAILIVAVLAISARQRSSQKQRSATLRNDFGAEYDRTLAEKGDARSAERELTDRQKRVAKLNIRPLTADEGQGFRNEWQAVQMSFVDDPAVAVRNADALVVRVMDVRGYPEGDFDQRFADMSVDHPGALDHYRGAHEIGLRHADGQASTEDLRQAVVHAQALFTELLDQQPAAEAVPVDAEVPTAVAV